MTITFQEYTVQQTAARLYKHFGKPDEGEIVEAAWQITAGTSHADLVESQPAGASGPRAGARRRRSLGLYAGRKRLRGADWIRTNDRGFADRADVRSLF